MSKRILSFRVKPLPFHATGSAEPPRPVLAQPGDEFIRVDVVDDVYTHIGFFKGFLFVAQLDRLVAGHIHYVELNGCAFLARLTEDSHGKIYVDPADRINTACTLGRAELSVFGAVVEMYPRGLSGSRWIFYPKPSERLATSPFELFRTHHRTSHIPFPLEPETGLAAFRKDVGMMRWHSDEQGYFLISDEIRAWLSLAGCDPDTWAGWGWIDFLHPEDRDAYLFRWSEAIETGKPYLNQGRVCISGIWLYMVISANPIRNASGRIVRWEGFLHLEAIETRLSA